MPVLCLGNHSSTGFQFTYSTEYKAYLCYIPLKLLLITVASSLKAQFNEIVKSQHQLHHTYYSIYVRNGHFFFSQKKNVAKLEVQFYYGSKFACGASKPNISCLLVQILAETAVSVTVKLILINAYLCGKSAHSLCV